MTDESNKPTSMADEVAKRVVDLLRPEFERLDGQIDQLRGEVRSKTKALGEDIDGINARMTADKASIDEHFNGLRRDQDGLRQDISRLSTTTKATLDSHTSRFRAVGEKLDLVADRLDRAHVPAE